MGEPKPQIPFLFVGNQLCLDFINTQFVLNGQQVDLLATFSDMVAWLAQVHLLTGEEAKKMERQWGRPAEGDTDPRTGAGVSRRATGDGRADCRRQARPRGCD